VELGFAGGGADVCADQDGDDDVVLAEGLGNRGRDSSPEEKEDETSEHAEERAIDYVDWNVVSSAGAFVAALYPSFCRAHGGGLDRWMARIFIWYFDWHESVGGEVERGAEAVRWKLVEER
jgi:hypothetical protein